MVRIPNLRLRDTIKEMQAVKKVRTASAAGELICPHCEGEIEIDDVGGIWWQGEFNCPLCDGVFVWLVDGRFNADGTQFDDAVTHTDNRIIPPHGFNEMHPVTKVAEVANRVTDTVLNIIVWIGVILIVLFLLATLPSYLGL